MLVRRVGVRHLEVVEDAVQSALLSALTAWTAHGQPANPSAWLYTAAHHRLIQELRNDAGRKAILERVVVEMPGAPELPPFPNEAGDDLLRMLFACCEEAIPWESQLVIALKTLCGFSTAEIALRLFTSEANIQKRLQRARDRLREVPPDLDAPPENARLPGVHGVLYLLFNEGYLSARSEVAIRRELCEEAIRLTTLLAEHPVGTPESAALLALMHLHAARLDGRTGGGGELVLLEEQDRSLWDRDEITSGMRWLARSATGDAFSRFHAEAGIAAEHCLAVSFAETRWSEIADLYALLDSPLHRLNRAVAVAEHEGPDAGLRILQGVPPPSWLANSYLWDAVLGDLHRRAGRLDIARSHRDRAIAAAPTEAIRALVRRRFSTV